MTEENVYIVICIRRDIENPYYKYSHDGLIDFHRFLEENGKPEPVVSSSLCGFELQNFPVYVKKHGGSLLLYFKYPHGYTITSFQLTRNVQVFPTSLNPERMIDHDDDQVYRQIPTPPPLYPMFIDLFEKLGVCSTAKN